MNINTHHPHNQNHTRFSFPFNISLQRIRILFNSKKTAGPFHSLRGQRGGTLNLQQGEYKHKHTTSHLCVEEGQTPDSVEGDQHFDQKLFMLRFQWQSETINYTEGRRKRGG